MGFVLHVAVGSVIIHGQVLPVNVAWNVLEGNLGCEITLRAAGCCSPLTPNPDVSNMQIKCIMEDTLFMNISGGTIRPRDPYPFPPTGTICALEKTSSCYVSNSPYKLCH